MFRSLAVAKHCRWIHSTGLWVHPLALLGSRHFAWFEGLHRYVYTFLLRATNSTHAHPDYLFLPTAIDVSQKQHLASVELTGTFNSTDPTQSNPFTTGTFTFIDSTSSSTTSAQVVCERAADAAWYMSTIPDWWLFLIVPCFICSLGMWTKAKLRSNQVGLTPAFSPSSTTPTTTYSSHSLRLSACSSTFPLPLPRFRMPSTTLAKRFDFPSHLAFQDHSHHKLTAPFTPSTGFLESSR